MKKPTFTRVVFCSLSFLAGLYLFAIYAIAGAWIGGLSYLFGSIGLVALFAFGFTTYERSVAAYCLAQFAGGLSIAATFIANPLHSTVYASDIAKSQILISSIASGMYATPPNGYIAEKEASKMLQHNSCFVQDNRDAIELTTDIEQDILLRPELSVPLRLIMGPKKTLPNSCAEEMNKLHQIQDTLPIPRSLR